MNNSKVLDATRTQAASWLSFAWHFAEIVIVMVVGMMALEPLWAGLFALLGRSNVLDRADVDAVAMATDMATGVALWMWYRGHGRQRILEMVGAIYVPFLVFFGPYWLGLITAGTMLTFGHALLVPAILGVMLRHRAEYSHRGHRRIGLPHVGA
jgi:predicted Na+-dependent transporter